jgi:hypothetical protein
LPPALPRRLPPPDPRAAPAARSGGCAPPAAPCGGTAHGPSRRAALAALALAALAPFSPTARAEGIELASLELTRAEEGLLMAYRAQVELPPAVADALLKGVPLYFVARADVYRPRWYWRDDRVARATRNWRLTWQPLTRRYRVNFGSLSQSYDTLPEALDAVQRTSRWKLADAAALGEGGGAYVEFSFGLDTSQLPRPLQIGFGGRPAWELAVERRVPVPEAPAGAASAAAVR